jgi:hypothetical protein
MKRILLIICLCFLSLGAFSQKKNAWSLEIGASTYNYFLRHPYMEMNSNRFNYEFYILPSKQFSWIKLTTGIMYSTKNIRRYEMFRLEHAPKYQDMYKTDYDIDYIKLPILVSVGYSFKRVKLSITGGFIFDHILNYRVQLNYLRDQNTYKDYKFKDVNIAVRGGITLSTEIFKNINLTLEPFIDYKIDKDNIYYLYHPRWGTSSAYDYYYSEIPNGETPNFGASEGGLLSYGLSVGFEYVF